MPDNLKRKTLAFLLLAVILTVLLAAALPALNLQPGIPLPFQRDDSGALQSNQTPQASISFGTFSKAILESILVLIIIYALFESRKGLPWKKILLPALMVGLLALIVLYILFAMLGVHINLNSSAPDVLPPAVNITPPPLGPLPPGLLWLVWGGLAALVILLGIWLIRWVNRSALPDGSLESEAQQAIQALQSGAELKDVILRCYVQMSRVLQKEQKLELKQTMTAREFERLLEARGFPPAPVHQLTGLFEYARYGHRQPGPGDEAQALDCLQAIVQYSRLNRETD
jgi:hypothetical protein